MILVSKWYAKHVNDPYVKKANKEGYRSRAVFKLQEIQDKTKVIKSGDAVADLGSAPGAWSEYLVKLVGAKGRVVSCDLLLMQDIKGVAFIQGDFCAKDTQDQMLGECAKFDVIVSDMAPNMTGMKLVDQANIEEIMDSVFDFSQKCLKEGGSLVVKCFHGNSFDPLHKGFKKAFKKVKVMKPQSSKKASKEAYLVGQGYNAFEIVGD